MITDILFTLIGFAMNIDTWLAPNFHIFPEFFRSVEVIVASTYIFDSWIPISNIWWGVRWIFFTESSLLIASFAFWVLNLIVGTRSHTGDHL